MANREIRALLSPLGMIFSAAHEIRRKLYERDLLASEKLSKPVISVGNLTVGGTGKSPFVDVLLSQIEKKGLKACVLTRGYGRKQGRTLVVSSTTQFEEAGDEPMWLARRHPRSLVAVGADRTRSAKMAEGADVYILDDGFQHFQIKRDLEIVLIDATRPEWHYKPLPWGFARDRFSRVAAADFIILTRVNQAQKRELESLREKLAAFTAAPLIDCSVVFEGFVNLKTGESEKTVPNNAFLLSGIGNPESFEKLMVVNQVNVKRHEKKPDHCHYSATDLLDIEALAITAGASCIVTTEKDAVKLEQLTPFAVPGGAKTLTLDWYVARSRLEFKPDLPDFYDLAAQRVH